jgi:hypothetical protein
VSQAEQRPHSPSSGNAKGRHKRQTRQTICNGAFAPALEHGKNSNKEQYDCDDAKNFQQHNRILPIPKQTRDHCREACLILQDCAVMSVTTASLLNIFIRRLVAGALQDREARIFWKRRVGGGTLA